MSDDKLERIEIKLDSHSEKLERIAITLERNTVSLEEHMKRTALNEEQVNILREELKPVETHVKTVQLFFKVSAGSAAFIGTLVTILKIFKVF